MKIKNLIRNLLIAGLVLFSIQNASAQLKVLSNGKVGFGLTNPQWGTIEIGNDGNHSGLAIYDPSAGGSTFRMFRIGSYGYLTRGGDTDRGIRMNDDGRTEIFYRSTTPYSYGFVSTVQAYNVRGLAVSYQGVHTFKVYGDGGVEGLHFWASSDEKLKEDIVKLDKTLDKLLKLEGVSYKFKKKDVVSETQTVLDPDAEQPTEVVEEIYIDDATKAKKDKESDRKELGLIAQEVEAIFPEAVRTNSEGTLMINYNALIPVLIEAIKEQQAEIEILKSSSQSGFKSTDDGTVVETSADAKLFQNKPNPFNEQTEIDFYLSTDTQSANLYIYDLTGKQIKNIDVVQRENGSIIIYANELQPGMYKYALIADGNIVGAETMILTD